MGLLTNQTTFETFITTDVTFDLTKTSAGAAHSAGACDGTLYRSVGTVLTCTLSSPECETPGTAYSWCDTDLSSQGPLQGERGENSGILLLTFGADVTGIHIETIGLDTVEVQTFNSSGLLLNRYLGTISEKDNGFLGLIPTTTTRSVRLIARRNVEWKIDALKAFKS